MRELSSIRIFPLSMFDFETEYIAKLEIANGLESGNLISNLYFNSYSIMDVCRKNLFLFQYKGKIIGKAIVDLKWEERGWGREAFYYLEDIMVFEDTITKLDIQKIWKDFKKFNSVAQNVPEMYMDAINKLCEEREKAHIPILGSNESFVINKAEGNRIEFYTTRYERVLKYRETAIKIHGTKCQICGFDFKNKYGYIGENYIEVHHKKPLFSLDEKLIPNPETDLVTICSNCHRMIHRKKNDIITPEKLKKIIQEQNSNNVNLT
ncbi:MAG: HNH endonuclease [Coprococcus sp.]